METCYVEWWLFWCYFQCQESITKSRSWYSFKLFVIIIFCLQFIDLICFLQNKQQQLRNNFIAGTIGGTVGTILNTPYDVVKTRIQNDSGIVKKYNWTLPAVKTVAQEEG